MSQLQQTDLRNILQRTPKDVRDTIKKYGLYLAGGFIRDVISGQSAPDIDLFGWDRDELRMVAKSLSQTREGGRVHSTKNAETVLAPNRMTVRFITRWTFPGPDELAKSFDFTVCQSAIWFADGKWQSVCHPDFYADLAGRRLVYTSPDREEEPGGSMLRVCKFLRRGYGISPENLAAVVERLVGKVDFEHARRTLPGGVRQALSGLLREVDPLVTIEGLEPLDERELG